MASPGELSEPLAMKVAVRFGKTGPSRFHSHHDLMRFWERALRRSGWPLRRTAGFNPHPRFVFPHALGVGVASRVEEVEVELRAERPLPELAATLAPALAPALSFEEIAVLSPSRKGRQVAACEYVATGWPETAGASALAAAAAALLARAEWWVERGPPRERTRADVRPFLERLDVEDGGGAGACRVRMRLSHTARGAGRSDEVVRALAEAVGADAADIDVEKTAMALTA